MMTRSTVFIAPSLLRPTAVVFLLFLSASSAYSQVSDMIVLRDALILRAPGSQIGVSARDRTPAEAQAARDKATVRIARVLSRNGAVIEEVRANSPASRAGLMKGDVVTVFDGEHVMNANQFSRLVEETPPGWTVKMTIVRNGKVRKLSITPTL